MHVRALAVFLLCTFGFSQQKQVSLSDLTDNNTSASTRAGNPAAGNANPGNVSRVDIHRLFPNFRGKVFAHYMPWWGYNAKHIDIGMSEHDRATVRAQVEDMIARGFDGVVVSESNSNDFTIKATQTLADEIRQHPGFQFILTYTKWGLKDTAALERTLQQDGRQYFSSPNYYRRDGRPVVIFFERPNGIDFEVAKRAVSPQPLFIFRNPSGFTQPAADGAFAWLPQNNDPRGDKYYGDFYRAANENRGKLAIGSIYPGMNDQLASWGKGRRLSQRCGKTLVDVGAAVPNSVDLLQVLTWNDYEEGTSVEPGMDNCGSLTIMLQGDELRLQPEFAGEGSAATTDHYALYSTRDGKAATLIADNLPANTGSVDLRKYSLPAGRQSLLVQMVGKPLIQNRLSNSVEYLPR
jgi:hypothetical protein